MTCHSAADSLVAEPAPRADREPWATDPCARPGPPRAAGEPYGAMILVLESGAHWPPLFEQHRTGHADVAIVAQEPGERSEELLRRTRQRVQEMRAAGRCTRTVVVAASGRGGAGRARDRALLVRALAGSLCHGCGALYMVAASPDPSIRRELRAVRSALEEQIAGVRVELVA